MLVYIVYNLVGYDRELEIVGVFSSQEVAQAVKGSYMEEQWMDM